MRKLISILVAAGVFFGVALAFNVGAGATPSAPPPACDEADPDPPPGLEDVCPTTTTAGPTTTTAGPTTTTAGPTTTTAGGTAAAGGGATQVLGVTATAPAPAPAPQPAAAPVQAQPRFTG